MPRTDPLLQPFSLKHLTLKNRIFSSAHLSSLVREGMPKEEYQAYHEEKAKGGLGLTMFGGSSFVSRDSPGFFAQLDVTRDEIVEHFGQFAGRVHRHGAMVMVQLTHLGRRTYYDQEPWLPMLAPSALREPAHRACPREMDAFDMQRVAGDFARAVRRCRDGGLDGCELVAYGHLLGQFLSPSTNHRTDAYGGSIEKRMRFPLEVLEAVRAEVGDDYVVGLRVFGDERIAQGLDQDACIEIARRFATCGMVDFLNVVAQDFSTDHGLADFMPGMAKRFGLYLPVAAAVKQAVDIPILHATRIAELATARHAITEGLVDLIGMTRAHIADPHIVGKLERGEAQRIRPCVGAAYCSDNRNDGVRCLHNAATGRETWMPHVIEPSRGAKLKVVIAGAGPGGLEAARVCGLRGHEVVVFEAADEVGGQIRLAAKTGWRKDIMGIAHWLSSEVTYVGADVRCNVYAEAGDVLAESPDMVIVATGGVPNTGNIAGSELVLSTWEILSGGTPVSGRVLLFDEHGEHQGASCASFLAAAGAQVELVTIERSVAAASMRPINFTAHLRELYRNQVSMTPDHRLLSVERKGNALAATLRNEYTSETAEREIDHVVVEHGTLPADDLFHALRDRSKNFGVTDVASFADGHRAENALNPDGEFWLYRIGDAAASRNIHAAIYDALRLCKDL